MTYGDRDECDGCKAAYMTADECGISHECSEDDCIYDPLIPLDPAAVSSPRSAAGSPGLPLSTVRATYPPVGEHSAAEDLAEIRRLRANGRTRTLLPGETFAEIGDPVGDREADAS